MTTSEIKRPEPRPYTSATSRFSSGDDTPRRFLERCLETFDAWEPQIGAFVHVNLDRARQDADASAERWREGRPLSPIDGMPLGIKDIIETADLPTEMGSPLFMGWRSDRDAASVAALREAGAVIVGKTVTTEFAASEPRGTRNPWDLRRTPGGSSSGSAASVAVGMVSAALGTQVIGSTIRPASYCGVIGFKPTVGALNRGGSHDYFSQSCTGVLATTLEDTWQVAYEIASRAGGDPGFPGLFGPDRPPAPEKPRRIAFLETAGWAVASDTAKQAFETALSRLSAAGIAILDRRSDPKIAALETAIANARMLSARINEWEARWPLNTYRERDEEKLSVAMRERLKRAEAMRLDDYRALLKERNSARACYADLAAVCDGCVTLSAPGPAPVGLDATGNPAFAVPASLLGIPAVSLPVLQDEGLPLGLQILGFEHRDDAMFSLARWVTSCVRA